MASKKWWEASFGIKLGFIELGFKVGREYSYSNTVNLGYSYRYLDEISDLRGEVRYLRNRLAVWEYQIDNILGIQRNNSFLLNSLLSGGDQVISNGYFSEGVFNLPDNNNLLYSSEPLSLYTYNAADIFNVQPQKSIFDSDFDYRSFSTTGLSYSSSLTSTTCSYVGCSNVALLKYCSTHNYMNLLDR